MNRCTEMSARMSEALDGRLEGEALRVLTAHLESCPACRHEYETLRQTVALLRAVEPVAAPVGLSARVRERLERPKALVIAWPVFNSPPARVALAAVAAVVVGVYALVRQPVHDTQPAVSTERAAEAPVPVTAPLSTRAPAPEEDALEESRVYPAAAKEAVFADEEKAVRKTVTQNDFRAKLAAKPLAEPPAPSAPQAAAAPGPAAAESDGSLWNARPAPEPATLGLSVGGEADHDRADAFRDSLKREAAVNSQLNAEPEAEGGEAVRPAIDVAVRGTTREAVEGLVRGLLAKHRPAGRAEEKSVNGLVSATRTDAPASARPPSEPVVGFAADTEAKPAEAAREASAQRREIAKGTPARRERSAGVLTVQIPARLVPELLAELGRLGQVTAPSSPTPKKRAAGAVLDENGALDTVEIRITIQMQ